MWCMVQEKKEFPRFGVRFGVYLLGNPLFQGISSPSNAPDRNRTCIKGVGGLRSIRQTTSAYRLSWPKACSAYSLYHTVSQLSSRMLGKPGMAGMRRPDPPVPPTIFRCTAFKVSPFKRTSEGAGRSGPRRRNNSIQNLTRPPSAALPSG